MTGDLEARVAALEALVLQPAADPEWTEEQVSEFRDALAAATGTQVRVLTPAAHLTQNMVRELLRECVTVVKPGETLIILAEPEWTSEQFREVQEKLAETIMLLRLDFQALVVPGAGLGIFMPGADDRAATTPPGL